VQIAILAALSTAGWISAGALGVFSQLKTMPWSVLSELIGLIYLTAIVGAFAAALTAPWIDMLLARRGIQRSPLRG
jgi:hypothetical protein